MDALETARRLKGWALEAGFHRAGVARLERSRDGDAFLAWLGRGDHAGMGYMERRVEARLDPARVLAGARSVLCVALQYFPAPGTRPAGDLWPRVARYARGRDYHHVMEARLAAVAARVAEAFPASATRPYVDTGPVLERELAARAGLGAVGKNTNLLHPEGGSWFLLGELFLTLDLAPDAPLADLCGTCSRCLEACPTGALPAPYRLDSNRCISYWTIEHRGALPEPARRLVGDWVFGCDVCQEVCPVNAAPAPDADPELAPDPRRAGIDLAALLDMGREEYVELFRGSPMKRAKLDGLRRNAAVAMGNRGAARYVGPLGRALASSSAVVRGHAAWALGEIGGEEAASALAAARSDERAEEVRREIDAALLRARRAGPGAGAAG